MKHECRITVLDTKCFPELQEKYLANIPLITLTQAEHAIRDL